MIIRNCRITENKKQENFFIEQLTESNILYNNELVIAAIQSLGTYGTPAAIEPLSGIKYKQYTKKAILQIQTRYSLEKGRLSLVNEVDLNGSLSLSTDDK